MTVMLPDRNKAPNIYLEEMYEHYQQNEDIQTTLAEVADAVVEATKEMSKVNPVLDADKIQDNVVLCLVNSTQNEELLKRGSQQKLSGSVCDLPMGSMCGSGWNKKKI